MKKYLMIAVTAFGLYACTDSSQNVVPTEQAKTNNHRDGKDDCPTVDIAQIVSFVNDRDIPDEYQELYNQYPEMVAIIKTEKDGELLGLAGIEPDELAGQTILLVDKECYDAQHANARQAIKLIILPGSVRTRELMVKLCQYPCT
jgi:hypothetical protein